MNSSDMQSEIQLAVSDFAEFYEAIHGWPPFAWQVDLAQQVCTTGWPRWIDLPTASGKTAVIDIAVFALAFQACNDSGLPVVNQAPRRIFFTVDRRLVVNQAFEHGKKIAQRLWEIASDRTLDHPDVLNRMTSALQAINGSGPDAPPLDCFELRGGIYRDDAWVRSISQPTLIATTVDQVGSRMLHRGYGVSNRNLPIHAGLTANDSLVILDEAHCSVPFGETARWVDHYRSDKCSQRPIETPFQLVQMTATPPTGNTTAEVQPVSPFRLTQHHYDTSATLRKRHECSKPVELRLDEKAKGKNKYRQLAKTLVQAATELGEKYKHRRIAIVVNRVATAKAAYELLRKFGAEADLLIGRMRPMDREALSSKLESNFASNPQRDSSSEAEPRYLVATQTIEVGADYDFDAMVSQCASLDGLKQRFGRLNRLGMELSCHGIIIAGSDDIQPLTKLDDDKPLDPIYGNSLARCWHRLSELADSGDVVDFGIRVDGSVNGITGETLAECSAPVRHAPVLMPAHVDMLCQTQPRPQPEPDIAAYLHGTAPEGKQSSQPSVRVCWRADLSLPSELSTLNIVFSKPRVASDWVAALEVCPPSSAECMSVPRYLVQNWLKALPTVDESSDIDGELADISDEPRAADPQHARYGLVWRGGMTTSPKGTASSTASFVVGPRNSRRLAEGDTVVFPVEFGGWDSLGHVPESPADPATNWNGIAAYLAEVEEKATSKSPLPDLDPIDIGEEAFQIRRAKAIVRLHPKQTRSGVLAKLQSWAVQTQRDGTTEGHSWTAKLLHQKLLDWLRDEAGQEQAAEELSLPVVIEALRDFGLHGDVKIYPGGIAWMTSRLPVRTGMPPLPSTSFDNDLESKGAQGGRVRLADHLSDVVYAVRQQTSVLTLAPEMKKRISDAAAWHDVGKADPRFQANLLDRPLSLALVFPHLLAKSGGFGSSRHSTLPSGFRHESLTAELLTYAAIEPSPEESQEAGDLLRYLVLTHHGFARPFLPACDDPNPPEVDLSSMGGPILSADDRATFVSFGNEEAQRANSRLQCADLFWKMMRRHGPWGCAYMESILRLSDWQASGGPGEGDQPIELIWAKPTARSTTNLKRVDLTGLEASNPLAFLAAIGTFQTLARVSDEFRFDWGHRHGVWFPRVWTPDVSVATSDGIIGCLLDQFAASEENHPALRDIDPNQSRRDRFAFAALNSSRQDRWDADWLSCEQSDHGDPMAISQLQTSRRDYHSKAIVKIIELTLESHLTRALIQPWDYADPLHGVSLHIEPREDRRHAYQWNRPKGDPTRKVHGGMIGANRLALEAWPMFQSLPAEDKLATTGFKGLRVSNTKFRWPVWSSPIGLDTVRSLLAAEAVQKDRLDRRELDAIGVREVLECRRILVGKTPNLSPVATVPV